jgi:16S rRNA C967 or C1407 C5-methylase (RsmB/RsmF family)
VAFEHRGEEAVATVQVGAQAQARAGVSLDTGPTLKLLPHVHHCDGFFAAAMGRS